MFYEWNMRSIETRYHPTRIDYNMSRIYWMSGWNDIITMNLASFIASWYMYVNQKVKSIDYNTLSKIGYRLLNIDSHVEVVNPHIKCEITVKRWCNNVLPTTWCHPHTLLIHIHVLNIIRLTDLTHTHWD